MITQLRFLRLSLSQHPSYKRILGILQSSSTISSSPLLLDIGPGLGQDIRKLIYDGVPASSIVGLELDPGLLELGYDLFRDRQTVNVPFVIGDLLVLGSNTGTSDPDNTTTHDNSIPDTTPDLKHRFSIINASSLLHLFPLPIQQRLITAMIQLLIPNPGSTILGWQLGSPTPMDYFDTANFTLQYRHSEDSFRELWADISRETGTDWRVEVCEMEWREETVFGEPGMWALKWEVVRL